MAKHSTKAHILIFPFPSHGHMLPLLDLAHHLSTVDLSITLIMTTQNLPLLDSLLARSPTITPLILPFPSVENFQDLPTMMHALHRLHQPLLLWARRHPSPPTALISDVFLGWTHHLAAEIPARHLVFSPSGALTISIINCLWRDMLNHAHPVDPTSPVPFPSLPGSPIYPWSHLPPMYRNYKEGDPVWEFTKSIFLANIKCWGYIFNTFTDLEGQYVEHMRADLGHERVWAVGPLRQIGGGGGPDSVLTWLEKFEKGSVLYVCFGSRVVLSPPQAAGLAAGLERSGVAFVWGVKGGWVPEGFEERVAGRGMVIKGWAPQVEVLGHNAVGWFFTHCGWNSTLEAIAAGVAMVTWPMTADQFINARLLVEEVGVAVKGFEGADVVPDKEEVARIVGEAVGGKSELRARALEMKLKAMVAVEKGGSSYKNLEEMVEMLNQESD